MPVRCPAQISRLVHNSRRVLARVDDLAGLPAGLDLILHTVHAGAVFPLVIERGHDDMPPLPPLRVIAVVADDEAADVVVPGVNSRHSPRVTPLSGIIIRKTGGGELRGGSIPDIARALVSGL